MKVKFSPRRIEFCIIPGMYSVFFKLPKKTKIKEEKKYFFQFEKPGTTNSYGIEYSYDTSYGLDQSKYPIVWKRVYASTYSLKIERYNIDKKKYRTVVNYLKTGKFE